MQTWAVNLRLPIACDPRPPARWHLLKVPPLSQASTLAEDQPGDILHSRGNNWVHQQVLCRTTVSPCHSHRAQTGMKEDTTWVAVLLGRSQRCPFARCSLVFSRLALTRFFLADVLQFLLRTESD